MATAIWAGEAALMTRFIKDARSLKPTATIPAGERAAARGLEKFAAACGRTRNGDSRFPAVAFRLRTSAVALTLALNFAFPAFAQPQINANTSLNALLQAPDQPLQRWFASTDPQGKNDDYVLVQPGQTVTQDLTEGNLDRLWSTAGDAVTNGFADKFEMTLLAGPRRPIPLLKNGVALIGLLESKAYTLTPELKYPAVRELKKGAQLIGTNRGINPVKWYYQVSIRPPLLKPLPVLPAVNEVSKRQFKLDLAPGQTGVIDNWKEPGLIYELQIALNEGSAKGVFEKLRLRCEWDGQVGVDVPLMSLTGQVAGDEFISNAICDYDGARLLLKWPMPFKNAKLSLINQTDKQLKLDVLARVQTFESQPSEFRFCALEQSATPTKGQPVSILKLNGQGAFVGLALDIKAGPDSRRQTFGFLEGNEIITADGERFEGTGTEDYFSSAWYYPDEPFFHPYEGLTRKTKDPLEVAAYRFHIPEPIPFRRELTFDFEHGNGNNAADMRWNWVAFWYERPPLTLTTRTRDDDGNAVASSPGSTRDVPVIGNDTWKLWLSVGAGVLLGLGAALFRRRRKRKKAE